MKNNRTIDQIISPPAPHWVGDGFFVNNFFPGSPSMHLQRMSPFFLMDYNAKVEFAPSNTPHGVGVHPHRGFETVTIAYQGKVAHHDSAGNSGIIESGDVQWMTAGSGVLHKEYHEKEWSKQGGIFQMVQLWVNLPAKFKMTAPKYQALKQEQFGKYQVPNNMGVVEVIAGNYQGAVGSAYTFTPIEMYNARINKGAQLNFTFPSRYNTGFLVIEGEVSIDKKSIGADHFILFAHEELDIIVKAEKDAVILILSGEPIDEPIVPYGPFLMNTKQEIIDAYADLNAGEFGYLED